jgi:hypothetical protein
MRLWSAEQTKIENGTWHEQAPKSVTFESALKLYREYSTVQNRSHRSYVEPALSVWEAHIKPSTLLAKVTTELVEDVKLRRAQAVGTPHGRQRSRSLEGVLQCMVYDTQPGGVKSGVASEVLQRGHSRLRYLTEDEYTASSKQQRGSRRRHSSPKRSSCPFTRACAAAASSTCGGTTSTS